TRKSVVSRNQRRKVAPESPVAIATESTTPSATTRRSGTPEPRVVATPGTVTASAWVRPLSGATSVASADRSNTTRVFAGPGHERTAVTVTAAPEAAPGAAPAASRAVGSKARAA